MNYFQYQNGELFAEEISVSSIAADVGTPFYLYSYEGLMKNLNSIDSSFSEVPHLICFSVKSNSSLAVLKGFANMGCGFEIVSGGELFRVLKAGADPKKIVFTGVGKTSDEIEYALREGIFMFNVESEEELYTIDDVARGLGLSASISVRVNPDIDPHTHPYISTGLKKNKFGINSSEVIDIYIKASTLKNINPLGISCHIGSQILRIDPFVDALVSLKGLLSEIKKQGVSLKYIDIGGGLGIRYDNERPPDAESFARAIIEELQGIDITLIIEPGRFLTGNAGMLVAKVLYVKEGFEKNFIIVDAAMNDLIRPSLYNAYHEILPIKQSPITDHRSPITFDVVGPVCESGDFFAKDIRFGRPVGGELIALMDTGAYGFAMSSNYNSRLRVPEVMVNGDKFYIIRKRENYEDLVRGEEIPGWLG